MLHRQFTLSSIALVGLLLPGFVMRADADYGLESKSPLSDPQQVIADQRTVGTWRGTVRGQLYYLHVGPTASITGESNWLELILVNPGNKPAIYLNHKIGFFTTIGDQTFFNAANLSVRITQLRGSTVEELLSSVARFDIFKYDVTEDTLDVWAADQKFVKEAIAAGKIKGSGATIDDTTENVARFVEESGPKLFTKKVQYTRMKGKE